MTGYDREEAVGRNCRFLQGSDTDPAAIEELRQAIDAGDPATVELKNYRKDGDPFWNRVSISPLRDDDGEISYWIGFQQDITEYKQHQRELERQNERLERFASIVSHDLRSPMSVAGGRIELANEDGDEDLEAAREALDRMETIVEDTLTLARQGDTVGELGAVDLSELVPECWRTADTAEATFEIRGDVTIHADEDRLRNLLENLFVNAVDHGGSDVTVRIGTLEDGDGFYVDDDGSGIPGSEREQVFDPGHTTAADGTGFGLAIVNEIAAAHGWTATVAESERGGARFEFRGVELLE
jgi:PAS domain S-box-containing protein